MNSGIVPFDLAVRISYSVIDKTIGVGARGVGNCRLGIGNIYGGGVGDGW